MKSLHMISYLLIRTIILTQLKSFPFISCLDRSNTRRDASDHFARKSLITGTSQHLRKIRKRACRRLLQSRYHNFCLSFNGTGLVMGVGFGGGGQLSQWKVIPVYFGFA